MILAHSCTHTHKDAHKTTYIHQQIGKTMTTCVSHTWDGGREKGKKWQSSHVETVFALKARSSFPGTLPQRESTSALLFLLSWVCVVSGESS